MLLVDPTKLSIPIQCTQTGKILERFTPLSFSFPFHPPEKGGLTKLPAL